MNLDKPKFEPIRTCVAPQTEIDDKDTPKYEPIKMCEKPKTEQDDRKNPKSRPGITFTSPNTEKDGMDDIASKPKDTPKLSKPDDKSKKIDRLSQKPKDKPKNKIEPRKIDTKKEPKHKLQPRKINPKTPPKHNLQPRKINPNAPPKHKIQPRKINPNTPPRHKIEPRKINHKNEPKNKIQPRPSTPKIAQNKIEKIPTREPKNTTKPEVNQLSLEQIKDELTKFNWKTISENWTVKLSANKEITLNPYELPSKENPLYKHKEWLQTAYNHKTWNLNDNGLRTISGVSNATVYKWRKKFNIPTKNPIQRLFSDGKQKECGRCHQIKPHNEFKLRKDKRKDKSYLRSNCSQCKSELNQIYLFKNKRKILSNINNGKYKEKCPECDTKFIKLPAFDFHHLDKNLKEEQRIRTYSNWSKTKDILEKEGAIPICKNCHSIKQATVFNKYSEIITRKNSFENTIEGLEKNIHQYMRSHLKYEKFDQIKQVKPWIKKRIVTEKLFNGKCVGCGEDKLPSLQFHHRDPKQKTYQKWSDLSNLNTSKIINKLKEDNAICLCANCHSMTESRHLEQNMGEILEKQEIHELITYYKEIHQRINNYTFPNQPELSSKKNNRLERNQQV